MIEVSTAAGAESIGGSDYAWPEGRFAQVMVGLVACLIAGLFVLTIGFNWAEDRFLTPADGSLLIDGATGTVYLYDDGRKRAIVNEETLSCWRQPGQHFIRYRALGEIPDGPPIQNREGCRSLPPPGFLIQPIGDARVFVSTGTSLRLVPNPRTLDCLSNLREIEPVAPSYIDRVPIDAPVPDGTFCPS